MDGVRKVIVWAFWGLVGLVVVVFCLANLQPVTVSLAPLPWTFTELPLAFWVFGLLAVGIIVGVLVGWMGGHATRRLASERKRRIRDLEREIERLTPQRPAGTLPPPGGDHPALPPSRDAA